MKVRVLSTEQSALHPLSNADITRGETYDILDTYVGGGVVFKDDKGNIQKCTPKLYTDLSLIEE